MLIGRFTPTCVGTISFASVLHTLLTVHPHVRGDNPHSAALPPFLIGSPPRAWGQCRIALHRDSLARFTPTCVGTILLLTTRWLAPSVHPHVRGDNSSRASRPPTA